MSMYDETPEHSPYFKRTNVFRIISLILAYLLSIGFFVYFYKATDIDGDIPATLLLTLFSLVFGCTIHGLVHFGIPLKNIFCINIVLGLMAFPFFQLAAEFTGGFYLILDTLRLIFHKPLIGKREANHYDY